MVVHGRSLRRSLARGGRTVLLPPGVVGELSEDLFVACPVGQGARSTKVSEGKLRVSNQFELFMNGTGDESRCAQLRG